MPRREKPMTMKRKQTKQTANANGVGISDVLAGYSSHHWTLGGTGITNFGADQLERYQAAIAKHGDEHMRVSDVPMTQSGYAGLMSLHDLKGRRDLSPFWETFYSTKPANKD